MKQRLISALPFAAVAVVGGVAVLLRLLTQFNPVDDEGYVLLSINEFLRGGNLYDEVFAQYGPFYFEAYGALFSLPGVDATHQTGRVVVALLYVVIATGSGLVVLRTTGDRLVAVATQVIAFAVLFQIVREPTHPIGLTMLLVLAIMVAALQRGEDRRAALALGGLAAALTLVKINMGIPAGAALVVAAAIAFGPERHRKAIVTGSAVLLGAIVIGISLSKIDVGWVRMLVLLELAGVAAILWQALRLQAGSALASWLGRFAIGAIATAAVICAVILALGTSLGGLVDGVLISPARHPADQSSDLMLPWSTIAAAALALAACWIVATGRSKRAPAWLRAAGRIAAAAIILLSIAANAPGGLDPGTIRLLPAVLLGWLVVVPPGELQPQRRGVAFGRLAVALVAVLEVMQAYPIGFSRVEAAAVPFTIVGGLLLSDGLRQLQAASRDCPVSWRPGIAAASVAVPAAIAVSIGLAGIVQPGLGAARDYRAGRSVALPGMTEMRLRPPVATAYEQLAAATRSCEPLVVVPSFYSIYPWTLKDPPTGQNANAWPLLLGSDEQAEVARAIEDEPGLCMLLNQQAEQILIAGSEAGRPPDRPLYRLLSETPFVQVQKVDAGEFGGTFTLLRRAQGPDQGIPGGGLEPLR